MKIIEAKGRREKPKEKRRTKTEKYDRKKRRRISRERYRNLGEKKNRKKERGERKGTEKVYIEVLIFIQSSQRSTAKNTRKFII